ncbi:MAG: DUF3800 domain-containing protein [Lawsonibacter sp.]|jgi:hypothetical protein|nr:DUF3800 domain-containing protein [Lawsonibacter sp.]
MKKILSVFIDESGDFGAYDHHAPYYIVSMVLHDQDVDLQNQIAGLNERLRYLGYAEHAIHTGPLIRREQAYRYDRTENRRRLFNLLFQFARRLEFHYITVTLPKKECPDVIAMTARLSRSISDALNRQREYLNSFEQIIVYYDNGQVELTKILTSVFSALFSHVLFRKVRPVDYKLFQVADLVCTAELLAQKIQAGGLTASELEFFASPREFKKNYLKTIRAKRL